MRVAVFGAGGRMGGEVCRAVATSGDLDLVAAVDPAQAGGEICGLTISADRAAVVDAGAVAVVDFTHPDAAPGNIDWCLDSGVHVVVGTSGFDQVRLRELGEKAARSAANVIVVPNFAIGAVLMIRLAELAAPFFDRVEVIEMHHDGKADAPSGTAVNTAERLDAARAWPDRGDSTETVAGSRGGRVGAVRVHAVRLPGPVAHQEVIFGTQGQTLSLRHDSYDRTSFMPGVLLALRNVSGRPGLTVGLEPLLGLM